MKKMNNRDAYNAWADSYDSMPNKTRDLEARALRQVLPGGHYHHVLEIGCGTGKNTEWLHTISKHVTGVDFSEEMLEKARQKIIGPNVRFDSADVRKEWTYDSGQFDLVTCSLVLEHIDDLGFVFDQARRVLVKGGLFYIGELHPFKQYLGTKARFDTGDGIFELECHVHHISDFFHAAIARDFECLDLTEWFDDAENAGVPRLISMVFRLKGTPQPPD